MAETDNNNPEAFEVDDAIVLLLGSDPGPREARGRIKGVTRLEKLLFLADKEADATSAMTQPLDFKAHNFGPFSQPVYQALTGLSAAGLINDSAVQADTDDDREVLEATVGPDAASASYTAREFSLTPLGIEYYKVLVGILDGDAVQKFGQVRREFAGWPLRTLLRYVYMNYPDYTEKSIIRDDVLGGVD